MAYEEGGNKRMSVLHTATRVGLSVQPASVYQASSIRLHLLLHMEEIPEHVRPKGASNPICINMMRTTMMMMTANYS